MNAYRGKAAAAITAVLLAAGCGSGGNSSSAAPANPVPILKMTGCPVPAGEANGSVGADSDRTAYCTWPGEFGETVWVYTYPTPAYRDNRIAHPLSPPSDGWWTIKGPGASLVSVNRPGGFTGPSPQRIAARVGGTLVTG